MSQLQQDTVRLAEEPILLTATEVGYRLSCSRKTIYRLIKSGDLRPVYIDARPRFEPSNLEELIARRRTVYVLDDQRVL